MNKSAIIHSFTHTHIYIFYHPRKILFGTKPVVIFGIEHLNI